MLVATEVRQVFWAGAKAAAALARREAITDFMVLISLVN
jgi:hypothetical protein